MDRRYRKKVTSCPECPRYMSVMGEEGEPVDWCLETGRRLHLTITIGWDEVPDWCPLLEVFVLPDEECKGKDG